MYIVRMRLEPKMKGSGPASPRTNSASGARAAIALARALGDLLADFAARRAASMGIVDMLCDSDWAREGYQPEYGTFTANDCVGH